MKGVYTHWIFVMETCINSDIHVVSELPGAFQWDF